MSEEVITRQLVVFSLGEEEYALPIADVRLRPVGQRGARRAPFDQQADRVVEVGVGIQPYGAVSVPFA